MQISTSCSRHAEHETFALLFTPSTIKIMLLKSKLSYGKTLTEKQYPNVVPKMFQIVISSNIDSDSNFPNP